jgi:hypothetical protein
VQDVNSLAVLPTQLPYNGYRVFPGDMVVGLGVDHPILSSAENANVLERYLRGPSLSALACHGVIHISCVR